MKNYYNRPSWIKIYETTQETLKSNIWNRVFKILTKNNKAIWNQKLIEFFSKDIENYKIQELKFILDFFTEESPTQQKYKRLLDELTKRETENWKIKDDFLIELFEEILSIPAIKKTFWDKKLAVLYDKLINSKLKSSPDDIKLKEVVKDDKWKVIYWLFINWVWVNIPFWFNREQNKYQFLRIEGEKIKNLVNIQRYIDMRINKPKKSKQIDEWKVLSWVFLNEKWYRLPFQLSKDWKKYIAIESIWWHNIESVWGIKNNSEWKIIQWIIKNHINNKIPFRTEWDDFKTLEISWKSWSFSYIIKNIQKIRRENFSDTILWKVVCWEFEDNNWKWIPFWLEWDKYLTLKIENEEYLETKDLKRDQSWKIISWKFKNIKWTWLNFKLKNKKYVKRSLLYNKLFK